MNNKKIIGVVHGGLSDEREKSLLYGKKVSKVLENLGLSVLSIHLHPNGSWTIDGQTGNVEESLKKVDAVWNCLVGVDGEKGLVESLCSKCGAKIIGHGELHTQLAGDKRNLKMAIGQHKIKVPFGRVITSKDYTKNKLLEIFGSVGIPAIVKPNVGSSAWGVTAVSTFTELESAVEHLLSLGLDVLVEKVVVGTPVSCFVFSHNNLLHTNVKVGNEIHESKNIERSDLINLRNEALYIHNVLAVPHHAEYDFILTPKGVYFLEMNTHPSLVDGYIKESFTKGPVNLSEYIESLV